MEQFLRAPPVISTDVDVSDSQPPRESDHDTEILSQSATEAFQQSPPSITLHPPHWTLMINYTPPLPVYPHLILGPH